MNELEIKEALRTWILKKNGKLKADSLTDETPIIEQRIISSLQIMDLILFLEKLKAESIDVEKLKPGVFRSVNIIYENFFKGDSHAKA